MKYDDEDNEIVRDPHGMCISYFPGQPGLCLTRSMPKHPLMAIRTEMLRPRRSSITSWGLGIATSNTGDLIREVDVGFAFFQRHYQFVDRTGDTFRWKRELFHKRGR